MQVKNRIAARVPRWVILFAYLAIAFSHTIAHDFFVDRRFHDVNKTIHEQVMTDAAPAPIQYRVMLYYTAEGMMRVGIPFDDAYFIIRLTSTFLCALALHYFLSLYFAPLICFAGVLYFFAALPVTYIRYYMQPMDLPNLFFFLVGFVLIVKRKDFWLVPLTIIAMINRETAVLLSLVYLFYRWDELPAVTVLARSALIFFSGMGTYWLLRHIFAVKHYYADLYYLGFNLSDTRTYLYALSLFGPLLVLPFYKLSDKPKFFRRALLLIPFFLVIHYTMTIMVEPRLWLPLVPILLGGALWAIVPDELKAAPQNEMPVRNTLAKYSKVSYVVLFACFLAFFAAFFQYYKNMHFKDRALEKRVEGLVDSAKAYSRGQWYDNAVEELNKAIVLDPKNDEAHYQLGLIYDYDLHDAAKALEQYSACLADNPYHTDRAHIKDEIDRLTYYLNKK
jgi:tetratricopeptide (TPR) repeat protein